MDSSSTSLKPRLPSSSSDGNPGLPGKKKNTEIDRHENQFGETEEFNRNAMQCDAMRDE